MKPNPEDLRRQQAILSRIGALETARRRRNGFIAGSAATLVVAAVVLRGLWPSPSPSVPAIQPAQVVAQASVPTATVTPVSVPQPLPNTARQQSATLAVSHITPQPPDSLASPTPLDPQLSPSPIAELLEPLPQSLPATLPLDDATLLADASIPAEQTSHERIDPAPHTLTPRQFVSHPYGKIRSWLHHSADSHMDGTTLSLQII